MTTLVPSPQLEDLAEIANTEHGMAGRAFKRGLAHAIAAGVALNEAFGRIPRGGWQEWLSLNFHGDISTAQWYRRLAWFRDDIEAATSVPEAKKILVRAGLVIGSTASRADEMKQLRRDGKSCQEISELYGISETMVVRYTKPGSLAASRARERRYRAETRAAKRFAERDQLDKTMRRVKGSGGKAWALIQSQLAPLLQAAISEATTPDQRRAWDAAIQALYVVEDRIVAANKTARATP